MCQHKMRCAIAPRLPQQVRDAAVSELRQALEAEGRARAVTTETLEPFAITGAHDRTGMYVEAVNLRTP